MNVSAVGPIRRARLYIIGNLLELINFSPVRYITYEQTAATLTLARPRSSIYERTKTSLSLYLSLLSR